MRVDDGNVTVTVVGNLDAANALGFLAELRDLCEVCVGDLVVDLVGCSEITTSVLSGLEAAHDACLRARCRLSVRSGHPDIVTALDRAGIHSMDGCDRPVAR